MKREIKFRAWDGVEMRNWGFIDRGFTGPPTESESFDYPQMQFTGLKDKNGKEIYEGDIVNFAVKKNKCNNDDCDNIDDLHIGQFCPDCGKRVSYEDSITKAKIIFIKGGFAYEFNETEFYHQTWQTFIAEVYIAWTEVIGNIYENPELLK